MKTMLCISAVVAALGCQLEAEIAAHPDASSDAGGVKIDAASQRDTGVDAASQADAASPDAQPTGDGGPVATINGNGILSFAPVSDTTWAVGIQINGLVGPLSIDRSLVAGSDVTLTPTGNAYPKTTFVGWKDGDTIQVSAPGDVVRAFTGDFTFVDDVKLLAPGGSISRSQDLVVKWGPTKAELIKVLIKENASGALLGTNTFTLVPGSVGTATIAAAVLANLRGDATAELQILACTGDNNPGLHNLTPQQDSIYVVEMKSRASRSLNGAVQP